MILPDYKIAGCVTSGRLSILLRGEQVPMEVPRLQPASVELTLSDQFLVYHPSAHDRTGAVYGITSRVAPKMQRVVTNAFEMQPGDFVIAATSEVVTLGADIVGRVEGKSTGGRMGLSVHITAWFIDPGFSGTITLELKNHAPWPITVVAGAPICQMALFETRRPDRLYGDPALGSHYQHQHGAVGVRDA